MKLKLDDEGHAVIKDGMPVYVHDDGTENPFDAAEAMSRIENLNGEAKKHRLNAKEANEKLEMYKGIEDPAKALKALETVKNLDDKKLIDAGEVEKLKKSVTEAAEADKKALVTTYEGQIGELSEKLEKTQSNMLELLISSEFNKSEFFTGEAPRTNLPPDVAYHYFKGYFDVEGEGVEAKVVGKLNGEPILSRKNYGKPATFDEAMAVIIDQSPNKERIMKATPGGPGATGGPGSPGSSKTIKRGDMDAFGKNLKDIAAGKVTVQ